MGVKEVLIVAFGTLTLIRLGLAGYCSENYRCTSTCYTKTKTTTGCVFLFRCPKYKSVSKTCTRTCSRQVCCAGYTGFKCQSPMCGGSTVCPNGGTCLFPNQCKCPVGFSSPTCADINECAKGTSGCQHFCSNTNGSFKCSCRPGYYLSADVKSCIDVNECHTNNGGCQHSCSNTNGSFQCNCRIGYTLNQNGKTCLDVNECQIGSSTCDHTCVNTDGSYRCQCRQGYTLDLDGKTCQDLDECSDGTAICDHHCHNTVGSHACSCSDGYGLDANGNSCQDINECSVNNGNCGQVCSNQPGSYRCECQAGYRLSRDGLSCTDIDECDESLSDCSQLCINTYGGFSCACNTGYILDNDSRTCIDVDDCLSAECSNRGTCLDGVASFTCLCQNGFTGTLCDTDVDECYFINGGCQDICTNTFGSYVCGCSGNGTLASDGVSCLGNDNSVTVFKRYGIQRQLLPKGCFIMTLTQCRDGKDVHVLLSSTSHWYTSLSIPRTTYTYGVVFIEVNSLSLPMSINGATIIRDVNDFTIKIGVDKLKEGPSLPVENNVTRQSACLIFNTTASDIFEFVSANSFFKSFVKNLSPLLPNILTFISSNTGFLNAIDLKTNLVYGRNMENTKWCEGAPVQPDHLYSVFRFDTNFTLSIYGKSVNFPKLLNGKKFCIIVDICQSYGGSVFFMVPDESRDILTQLTVFKNLKEQEKLQIKPRGIGISISKGVNVHFTQKTLELWNGEHIFNYPAFGRGDLWIGGDVVKDSKNFKVEGSSDIYLSIPSPERMLTAMFIDEWNVLIKMSATSILKFKVFKETFSIPFGNLNTNIYMSVGGTQPRQWCGDMSNPPGIFLTTTLKLNPFLGVPILEDWIIDYTNDVYAYFTSDAGSQITGDLAIDIVNDIIQLNSIVNKFKTLIKSSIQQFGDLIRHSTKTYLIHLQHTIEVMYDTIIFTMKDIKSGNIKKIVEIANTIWDHFKETEKSVTALVDAIEFQVDVIRDNFTSMINQHIVIIKDNIDNAVGKMARQILDAVEDYSGFGLKYRATISLFGLKLFGVDIELVYAEDNIRQCSRFDKVNSLLKGKAVRFLITFSREKKLGKFLRVTEGAGGGGAFGIDSKMIIVQLTAYFNILGIKATADLFIANNRIHAYLEGNIWGHFLAQIDITAELGKEWDQLKYNLKGSLVAKSRKKRQTQTDSTSFQDSYLDALLSVTSKISENANKRLSQVQQGVTIAQNGLVKAQKWLNDQKVVLKNAHSAFDQAVAAFESAKQKLEEAKGPFEKAVQELNNAQKNIDNLCKIKSCKRVCIPGLRCRTCRGSFGIRYPCCRFTKCMIQIYDPICLIANTACRVIRLLAYTALEVAKIFVKIPMMALDVAKGIVSVAQIVVDKSRFVLDVAEGVLDIAVLGLEGAKGVLEIAKYAVQAVKIVIGAAVKVLQFVIEFGLKNILDVRNCGFNIDISTIDLPIFDVSCQVNAFKLGWKTISLRINFNNVLQSIWQAATETIKAIMNSFVDFIGKRKKREIVFDSTTRMHLLIRKMRETDQGIFNTSDSVFNETINVISGTIGAGATISSDYDSRVLLYEAKCTTITQVYLFLQDTFDTLFDIVNETKSYIDQAESVTAEIESDVLNIDTMSGNVTLENADISIEYAMEDYNLTSDDLENALNDAKVSMSTDPLLQETIHTAEFAKENIQSEISATDSFHVLNHWLLAMENMTKDYFDDRTKCASFQDCVLYSIFTLYDLYSAEVHPNMKVIENAISLLETNILELFSNTSQGILAVHKYSVSIQNTLSTLSDMNLFCSQAPRFVLPLHNQTIIRGTNFALRCYVTADPLPMFWWYKNDEPLDNVNSETIMIKNVTDEDEAVYKCVAGNIVANLSSNDAYLFVKDPVTIVPDATDTNLETEPIETLLDEQQVILASTFSVLAAGIIVVVVVVIWKKKARLYARDEKLIGSFASLNMVRPTTPKPVFKGADPGANNPIKANRIAWAVTDSGPENIKR